MKSENSYNRNRGGKSAPGNGRSDYKKKTYHFKPKNNDRKGQKSFYHREKTKNETMKAVSYSAKDWAGQTETKDWTDRLNLSEQGRASRTENAKRKNYSDRQGLSDRQSFSERPGFADRQSYSERQGFTERQSHSDRQGRDDRQSFSDRQNSSDRNRQSASGYSNHTDYQNFTDRQSRTDRDNRTEQTDYSDRTSGLSFQSPARPQPKRGKKGTGSSASRLKIIPLGGLEQIGMNITAFEYGDSIVVVDCGLSFPEDEMLGIDMVIPDVTYLKENISKVKGFVITHGHEDHIGALPYVLRDVNVPIYSTKLTLALIANKLKEHNLTNTTKLKEVKHGQVINLGDFSVEFIKTNHSIQDASALAIYSPVGIVVHTGDFKVDYTPVFGDAIDLQRFAEIGKKGVLAVMCDSTNAERPGFTMSERTVGHVFENLFNEHKTSRIIIATFASNVDRVQQIINTAYHYGRKVAVEGRSMVNVISTAAELGYLRVPDQTLIEIDQVKNYPDEQVVLITTGSQGESMAALSRMAADIHKKITIKPNDTIIFSSNPIPGNEKAVSKVINELSMKGAKVIFQDAHVSGHACQEEIKLIYSLVKPKYAIPVHGEYRHLTAQKHVVEELGYANENIFMLKSGDVLEMDQNSAEVTGHVHTGAILVDGLGVGDVGNIVLRDRQHLAEDGIIIVVLTLERHSNVVLAGPDIVSRGFVYVRESEDLMGHARDVVSEAVDNCLEHNITDWGKLKTSVKDALSDYVWKRTKRSPMILPIIMEA